MVQTDDNGGRQFLFKPGADALIRIDEKHRFEFERVRSGLLLMLYGYFQKVVLSGNLAAAKGNSAHS